MPLSEPSCDNRRCVIYIAAVAPYLLSGSTAAVKTGDGMIIQVFLIKKLQILQLVMCHFALNASLYLLLCHRLFGFPICGA
jgi:hypothetical protein